MRQIAISSEQFAGIVLGALGGVVALRWITNSAALTALIPYSDQMGLNTPLLFLASGFCLYFLQHRAAGPLATAWKVAAGLLLTLPLLVLFEHLTGMALGIDFVRVPTPPTEAIPHPGRIAPNTCAGFLLAGVCLLLMRQGRRGMLGNWVQLFASGAVLLIGASALLGYVLNLQSLYRVAAFNAMVPPTAAGMSVLGMILWSVHARLREQHRAAWFDQASRITVRAISVVALVAVVAGAAGFSVMRDSYEQSISNNMRQTAASSVTSLRNTLDVSLWVPHMYAGRGTVRDALVAMSRNGKDEAAKTALLRLSRSFMEVGGSAIAFYSVEGELGVGIGRFMHGSAISRQPLTVKGQRAVLLWRDKYMLYTENDIYDGERLLGRMVAEQHLPLFDQLLADYRNSSASSDVLVCSLEEGAAYCAPTRFYPKAFRIPMYRADGSVNLPVNHALLGRSGVTVTRDLRGIPVFAAYAPVPGYGLAVVVKTNVDTLYGPLRDKANTMVLVLVGLVVLGASLLLIQVRPVVAQLVREKRRTQVILENSNDAFVALGVDGLITDWNTEAERTFGWRAQEAIGRNLAELIIPPDQRAAHNAGFARFAETGTGPVINARLEVSALRKDGSEIPIELSVAAMHTGAGYVANAFMRDITERRRLTGEIEARARELELERDRAEAANRAKGEFVAHMSHELRTPMNAVLGMTYLLSHTELKAEQKKYLEMIRSSGQSLLAIMNDILDFSKVEAGQMQLASARFNLGDMLSGTATIMSVNAGDKDLELAIGVEPDVPRMLNGDALRLQQILVNLVGNAIKFTERGEVVLHVALLARDGPHATLQFTVRDTGIGMDQAHLSRLFSPFTQGDASTTRRFGGTGLGLTISKRLVELMGGSISVDSAAGRGAEFRITLPLQVEADQDDRRRTSAMVGPLRLLIVDDHATSRDYLAKTVAGWGWESTCVASGEAALAAASHADADGRPYDVVMLDWQMPGMDGAATMAALRKARLRSMPVALMVNAYGRGRLVGSGAAQDADAVLTKPVTGSSLFDTLQEVLVKRGLAAPVAPQPTQPAQRLDGLRVLLAEDNELNQAVARGVLEGLGALLDIVDNGDLAVKRLAEAPAAYDLVLMDIQMPVLDGYAATRQIRGSLGLQLPVLAMTAGVTEGERQACREAGMNDLIAKPIEVDEMLATIARHAPQRAAPAAEVAQAPPSLPVLNLAPLVDIAKGNPQHLAAVAKLVRRMVGDSEQQFAEAVRHWKEGHATVAARMLHSLRGGVGSVGAKRFASTCLALEHAIREQGDAAELFEQAGIELDEAMAEARVWLVRIEERANP